MRVARLLLLPLLAASALPVAAAGSAGITAAGVWFSETGWDLGQACGQRAEPRQSVSGAWAELGLGAGLSARLEAGALGAAGYGDDLEVGDGIAGDVLLSYQPSGGPWRVQLGVGSPPGGELSAGERDLVRLLADPVLGYPVSPAARGWQLHLGALGGIALRRGLALVGGVARDQCLAHEVMPGIRLDPTGRLLAQGGLVAGGERRGAELRLTLALDSRQRLNGQEICSRMTSWGAGALAHTDWGILRLEGSASAALSGSVRWPSATELLAPQRSDPGSLGELSLGIGLDRGARLGSGWRLRPVVTATGRRFLPADLPYGDGWTVTVTPGVELSGGPYVFEAAAGWGSGGWRPWCGEARGPQRDIEGAQVQLTLRWAPAPPPAARSRGAAR